MSRLRRSLFLVLASGAVGALSLGASCSGSTLLGIHAPAHGAFIADSSVEVRGGVVSPDLSKVELLVNGSPVAVDASGNWSTTLVLDPAPVFNPIVAEVRDASTGSIVRERIVVHHGVSGASGLGVAQGVGMHLSARGFEALSSELGTFLAADVDVQGIILAHNPYPYCILVDVFTGQCLSRIDIEIQSVSFEGFSVDAAPAAASVAAALRLEGLRLDYRARSLDCRGVIRADAIEVGAAYALAPAAGAPTRVDVSQVLAPRVAIDGYRNEFTGGWCDTFEFVLAAFAGDSRRDLIEALETRLADPDGSGPADAPLAGAIQSALAGISLQHAISQGIGITLDAPLSAVRHDPAGVTFAADSRFTADPGSDPVRCPELPDVPRLPAWLHVPEGFPELLPATPEGGLPYGLALGISSSAFNQLMSEMTRCGLLYEDLRELPSGEGSVPITAGFLAEFDPAFAKLAPSTPLRIELRPTLAPILTGGRGPGGELAELRISSLVARVVVDDGSNQLTLAFGIDATAGLTLGMAEGEMVFGIGTIEGVETFIRWNSIGANVPVLEQEMLPSLLASALPALASGLGIFPLPSFAGLQLVPVEVSRQGGFIGLFADLAPIGE